MKSLAPSRKFGPLGAPGMVVVAAALGLISARDLAAQEPSPWGVPRGRFFAPPGLPDPIPSPLPVPDPFPIPIPIPPGLSDPGATGPTDRCLIVAPATLDARSIRTADAGIDPGVFARPRVRGLPIRGLTPRERRRR